MAQQPDLTWPILGAQIMSTVLTAGGQFQRGNASQAIGQRTAQADRWQAQQLIQGAGQEIAAAQRTAENQDLATSYIVSQALARAAASGGGASDATVIHNIARIQAEGKYRSNVARYEGDTKARNMTMQANALDWMGENAIADAKTAKNASLLGGFSTILTGAAKTMAGKYGTWD